MQVNNSVWSDPALFATWYLHHQSKSKLENNGVINWPQKVTCNKSDLGPEFKHVFLDRAIF